MKCVMKRRSKCTIRKETTIRDIYPVKTLEDLFRELVPSSGPAENLAGEIVRAINRIAYRRYNDGDRIGVGYGRRTCNPPARFLIEETNDEIKGIVIDMWDLGRELSDEGDYDYLLQDLCDEVTDYVLDHPELREIPSPDMWSDKYSDIDEDDPYEDEEDGEDY